MFPTGAYAHSFGLEGAVQDNLVSDTKSLRVFLSEILVPSLAQLELPTVAHAWRFAKESDLVSLCELDQQYAALKSSREVRDASAAIGSQRLELLAQLTPHPFLDQVQAAKVAGEAHIHEAIVTGTHGALINLPLDATLSTAYYQALAVQANAALKLIRIGQLGCQRLIAEFLAQGPDVINSASNVAIDQVGGFTPSLDIVAARHETAYTRLFIS